MIHMGDAHTTILIVDDDDFTAQLTALLLREAGYETLTAEGGMDAIDKIMSDPNIGVVVSDLEMPYLSGLELWAELRESGFTHPFVLLTGQDTEALRQAHPEIDDIIAKDERLSDILPQRIETLLRRLAGIVVGMVR